MTKITNFVWNPIDDCVISELDETGSVQAVYTNEPQQYGGVISQRRGTATSTLHADALGTTRALTDSSGNVTDTYLFDAWGNLVTSSGTTVNPFRWVGRYGYYHDSSTGLVYVRARMFQPTVARWESIDPIGFKDDCNLFMFTRNSPALWLDPTGFISVLFPKLLPDTLYYDDPIPPLPGDDDDLLTVVLPCKNFTVDQWGEDLCNFADHPTAKGCKKRCTCSDMKDANTPMTGAELQALFNRLKATMIPAGCNVDVVLQQQCAKPGAAVACMNQTNKNGPHKLCFPTTGLSRCRTEGLMMHELTHVQQFCNGNWTGRPRDVNEEEAYRIQCELNVKRDCTRPDKMQKAISDCLRQGGLFSNNGSNVLLFNQCCQDIWNTVNNQGQPSAPTRGSKQQFPLAWESVENGVFF